MDKQLDISKIDQNLKLICDYIYLRYIEDNINVLYSGSSKISIDYLKTIQFSNVRLQKLLFLFYGLYYTYKHEELFAAEFEAWKNGPVINDIYVYFRSCIDLIDQYCYIPFIWNDNKKINIEELNKKINVYNDDLTNITKELERKKIDVNILNKIYRRFNFLETFILVNTVHNMKIYTNALQN